MNSDSLLWLLIRVTQGDLKDGNAWDPSPKSIEVQSKLQYCFMEEKSSVGDPMCCQVWELWYTAQCGSGLECEMSSEKEALDTTLSSLNFSCGHAKIFYREMTLLTGNESAQWCSLGRLSSRGHCGFIFSEPHHLWLLRNIWFNYSFGSCSQRLCVTPGKLVVWRLGNPSSELAAGTSASSLSLSGPQFTTPNT